VAFSHTFQLWERPGAEWTQSSPVLPFLSFVKKNPLLIALLLSSSAETVRDRL